jgi:hypothetical protein
MQTASRSRRNILVAVFGVRDQELSVVGDYLTAAVRPCGAALAYNQRSGADGGSR